MTMESEAPKMRIVKCPKCRRLLTEFADVPVYICGSCGAVLKAKKRQANKGNGASEKGMVDDRQDCSSEKRVSEASESSNDVPSLLNKQAALLSDSNNIDGGSMGEDKHSAVPSEKASSSDSEIRCHKEEESLGRIEKANTGAALTDDNSGSTGQPGMPGEDTIFATSDQQGRSGQVNMDSCADEKLDDSSKVSEHGSVNSCSSCKIGATESGLASEEGLVIADPGNVSCEKMNAPTTEIVPACDGNDSSYDGISTSHEQYLLLSSAIRNKNISDSNDTKEKDGKEDILENMEESNRHPESRNLSLNPSDETCAPLALSGGSYLKQRSSSNHAYCRENSQHSEIFHSARKELEDDSLSRSLSRDSSIRNLPSNGQNDSSTRFGYLENDRMELLRKVNELRDHLTRPYLEGKGIRRFHIRDTRQDSHQPLFFDRGSDKKLQFCNSDITQSHSRFFGQRATGQPFQPPRLSFSGHGKNSCLHHHPKDWCIPVQLPPNVRCRACTYPVFCHPSTVSSPGCCKDSNVALCSHKSHISDQHFEKLHRKEKRQPLKRHCRPVSGGAPFVICDNCMQLLQLPADFLVSRARYHKLKCGGCSEVLIFLSHGDHIVPHSGTQLDPAPSEIDNAAEQVRRSELPVDHSCGALQGDPVSYSEDYGPPFSLGYSTDGEPVPHILRSSLERKDKRRGKQAIGSPLHRLMGYDSATELIYQPSDIDEAYESTDVAPFYRASQEIHLSEVHGGTGMDYRHQGHSEIECSPEHTEVHREDVCVRRSADQRGGSPLRGFFKKGIKELNHGLESMKLKLHPGGRVIPAP